VLVQLWIWLACSGGDAPERHALTGTVVEVREDSLLVAHDDIPGFMDAMTMPLTLANPRDAARVTEGDTISGTLLVGRRTVLTDLVVTERSQAPAKATPRPGAEDAIPVGAAFPETPVRLTTGETLALGAEQEGPIALTFIYTRCPLPDFCPLVMRKMMGLQADLPDEARIVVITIDPGYDTLSVLKAYGEAQGAEPGRTDFGRVPKENLVALAERAGLSVQGEGLDISHDLVLVLIGADGRVVARYDHMEWDRDQVLGQLGE